MCMVPKSKCQSNLYNLGLVNKKVNWYQSLCAYATQPPSLSLNSD